MKTKTQYPVLWDTIKAVLGDKSIALSVYIKKLDRSNISNLAALLKALGDIKGKK